MLTSARNVFNCAVTAIRSGPIISEVDLATKSGLRLAAIISNESLEQMDLAIGCPVTAMVKAPWVVVGKDVRKTSSSARNCFAGKVETIKTDGVAALVSGKLDEGTPVAAMITAESVLNIGLQEGDAVWFFFKGFSVLLTVEASA